MLSDPHQQGNPQTLLNKLWPAGCCHRPEMSRFDGLQTMTPSSQSCAQGTVILYKTPKSSEAETGIYGRQLERHSVLSDYRNSRASSDRAPQLKSTPGRILPGGKHGIILESFFDSAHQPQAVIRHWDGEPRLRPSQSDGRTPVKHVEIWYLHVPYYFLLLPINA